MAAVPATFSLSQSQVEAAIDQALGVWAAAADISFQKSPLAGQSQSTDISFVPLDGPGGTLARAWFPADTNASTLAGDIQFDTTDNFEVGNRQGNRAVDFLWVAVHEIGHALGLDHSQVSGSVLQPIVNPQQSFSQLAPADVQAIERLYAANPNPPDDLATANPAWPAAASGSLDGSSPGASADGTDPLANADDHASLPGHDEGAETDDDDAKPPGEDESAEGTTEEHDDDEHDHHPRHRFGMPPLINPTRLVNRLDRNTDGLLGEDEVQARIWRELVDELQVDANADGLLSIDELAAGLATARAEWFAQADSDSDGLLSRGETSRPIWNRLSRADADGDQLVSLDELEAWVASRSSLATPMEMPRHDHGHRHGECDRIAGRTAYVRLRRTR